MIKILSGFSGPGGSTIAFSTLVNLFNSHNMPSCFYGPIKWEGINCNFDTINNLKIHKDDIFIFHFFPINQKLPCKLQILSCHETSIFPIKDMKDLVYDKIHFVSNFQKNYQKVDGVIIPNPIRNFDKVDKNFKIAGIIGSIDPNKRVEKSIMRAKSDGFKDIRLYGNLTDPKYFQSNILPLLSDEVTYRGVATDMNTVYKQISHVYHSPLLESFNLVKPECLLAGVQYMGEEGNDTEAEYWDNEKIVNSWRKFIYE